MSLEYLKEDMILPLSHLDTAQRIKPVMSRHCLGTIVSGSDTKLFEGQKCLDELKAILQNYNVRILGDQLHIFPNKSFTLLIGLAESHISIHTWPERMTVQLDVFLCNYENDNTEKCEQIYRDIVEYFEPTEDNTTIVERL